jgi:hypothetical protein
MRYVLAAVAALAIGSQADAQLIRRYARPAYTPYYSQSYNVTPSYYSAPSTVITAGYYTQPAWSGGYVYPSSYSTYGAWNGGYSYDDFSYLNPGWRNGWRRGWRW